MSILLELPAEVERRIREQITDLDGRVREAVALDLFRSETISINDLRLPDDAVKMYPNPAHDILFVEIPDFTEGVASAQIFDVTGRIIHSERTNFDLFRINTSRYAKGIYFLKVEIGGKFLTKKFVVD